MLPRTITLKWTFGCGTDAFVDRCGNSTLSHLPFNPSSVAAKLAALESALKWSRQIRCDGFRPQVTQFQTHRMFEWWSLVEIEAQFARTPQALDGGLFLTESQERDRSMKLDIGI